MKIQLLFFIFLGLLFSQDCKDVKALYDEALYLDASEKIKTIDVSSNQECLYLAFDIQFKLEDFNEAKNYLDKLLKLDSDNSEYNQKSKFLEKILQKYKAAKYTLDKIDIDEAISEYKSLLNDNELSSISIFHSGLATAYKKKDRNSSFSDSLNFDYLDLCVENYKKAHSLNPYKNHDEEILNVAKYLTNLGKNSIKNDELDYSMKYLSKAIEYDSNYPTANFYLGNLYMKNQDYELAIESYRAGLGSKVKTGNYKILYLLGSSYQRLGNLDKAKEFFEYSLNNKSSYTKARFALANVLYSQQNYNDSKDYLLEIIDKESSYIKAYELLVNLFLDTKKYNEAREYSIKGIEINPKSYFLYSQLAFLDNENQQYSQAIENAKEALSLKRNYGPALIALATANVYLCNLVAAEDAFRRAKSYDRRQVSQLQDWAKEHNKTVCKK